MKTLYMELLEKANVTPNFFCSDEMHFRTGMKEVQQDGLVFWQWKGIKEWVVSPPMNVQEEKPIRAIPKGYHGIWADFPDASIIDESISSFMDWEFIYQPKDFLNLEGSNWKTFRKNIKKFPARFNGSLSYISVSSLYDDIGQVKANQLITQVVADWAGSLEENTIIHDAEGMLQYALHGQHRKVLVSIPNPYKPKREIFGINVWDYNYRYINFRFCICKKEMFLSEYLRYLFYTDPEILNSGKLVNDGGSVGNENLERFKKKLNPLYFRMVHSWTRAKESA